jgi:hypothetical protein
MEGEMEAGQSCQATCLVDESCIDEYFKAHRV